MEFHVLCLCAEWCHTCGDLEVENFPTIRVTRGEELLSHGPMEPLHRQLRRLLASLMK